MLWDVRFSVGLLARYASVYLRDLLAEAKTANATSQKRKHGDSGPLTGRGDDSSAPHNGADAEDDSTSPRKRQKGAEDAIASTSDDSEGKQADRSDRNLVQEPPYVIGKDTKNATAAEPILLGDGTLVFDPTPGVAVLDEEGMKWCAFIIANLKAQMPASVDMGAEESPSAPREVSWY
ncbi:hypothetical protein EXIGLDRAFT_21114 [Exidia glandulosa HHB12029]|uniref:Uncharacterized protein n=1 Tax=Exidia glandulosa HHB12029 TaxID=1314781 RepID=A0A165QZ07_EXIGL|nr:hypothetical protein EXIGLDRAFT_21114 [Exidia glandulosa HHB12029]